MSDKMVIGFTGKVVPKKPVNDQMTLCKCYVMAIGKNQNKSNISKEASDDALPSLFNIPVVGHLFVDKNNNCRMGGHDMALEKDDDGNYKFKVLTVPYGVVPQQDNVHYEEVEEDNGTVKTYLVADVILWTGRYPELLDATYSKEIYFAQSMEINPSETSKEEGYLNVLKYQYSALCLLGKSDNKSENIEDDNIEIVVNPVLPFAKRAEMVRAIAGIVFINKGEHINDYIPVLMPSISSKSILLMSEKSDTLSTGESFALCIRSNTACLPA